MTEAQIKKLSQADAQAKVAELQAALAEANTANQGLEANAKALAEKVAKLDAEYDKVALENEELEAELKEATKANAELNEKLADAETAKKSKLPIVKIGKDTYAIAAGKIGLPAQLQAKYGLGSDITAAELAANAELAKELLGRKVGFLKKVVKD